MKMTTNNIPQGYKNSPLGIIPEEWEIKKIKDIGKVVTGNTPSTTDKDNYGKGYPFVSPADLSDSKYIINTERELTKKGYDKSRKLPQGAVLFTCIGSTIGKMGIALNELSSNQQINAIICNKAILNEYLYYELRLRYTKIKLIAGEQAVPIINKSDFENIKIIIPPLPEQQKIAEVLSTWDKAIEKQSQLIEKFELRKKGLMQQLLTGKKRLPVFNNEWEITALKNCASIIGGGTPNTANENYWHGNIAWFTPSEIGKSKYVYKSLKYITKEGLNNSSANLLPVGTILFTSRATIGQKAILKTEAATNQGFQSLIISDVNSTEFFFYLLDILITKIKKKASGSTFPEISAKSLGRIKILIPPQLKEQKAIAKILSFCDEEINLATQRLESLKQQKKGLMQVLLTGKKRIIQ